MPTLRIDGIEKSFAGKKVLDGVSLEIEPETFTAILGPAGSGKTTLLEAIIGLRAVQRGRIRLCDCDVTDLQPALRGIGYVPQDGALFSTMTVASSRLAKGPASARAMTSLLPPGENGTTSLMVFGKAVCAGAAGALTSPATATRQPINRPQACAIAYLLHSGSFIPNLQVSG